MITKFEKYNESIKSLLVGPTEEEVWTDLMNGKLKGLIDSIPESPEDFLFKIMDGCKIIRTQGSYTYWGKIGISLFQQYSVKDELWVSYRYIYNVLETVYGLSKYRQKSIIKKNLKNIPEFKNLIPINSFYL